MKLLRTILPLAASLAVPAFARADTIFRTDGKPIERCEVLKEDLKEVTYREEGKEKDRKAIASDKVVRIEYDRVPKLLDQARESLKEDQTQDALDSIESYLDSVLAREKGDTRYPWAPAYALHRLIVLRGTLGDLQGVVAAADRLIEKAPDSLYVPRAYLAKADALRDLGQVPKARSTLQALQALVESKGLSRRWKLESDLSLALIDLKGEKLQEELAKLSGTAGDEFPTVYNRARLAEAQSFIDGKQYEAAESILRRTIESGVADEQTMAGAYTGLGDCQFQRAAARFKEGKQDEAEKLLNDALLSYMRVVVSYADQSRYVPKAMFFAGRTFDQFQDEESKARARRMYGEVIRQYQDSPWAKEARDLR
jgi:tetratricopeptide (TPR) repeat protein